MMPNQVIDRRNGIKKHPWIYVPKRATALTKIAALLTLLLIGMVAMSMPAYAGTKSLPVTSPKDPKQIKDTGTSKTINTQPLTMTWVRSQSEGKTINTQPLTMTWVRSQSEGKTINTQPLTMTWVRSQSEGKTINTQPLTMTWVRNNKMRVPK
jgi:hypothetical protein